MANTYTCAYCKGVFEKGWDDTDAEAELKEKFGEEYTPENCDVVCDDCYKRIMNQ